ADGDSADAHGLGRAYVLVGKTGAAVAGAQTVARDAIVGERHRRAGRPVITLIHSRGAHGQGPSRDGRGGVRRGRAKLVVGRVRAAQTQARGGDGFACAGRFGGEARGAPAQADVVEAEHSAQAA